MRGNVIGLVCFIALHYLAVIDGNTIRLTDNGVTGKKHDDGHSGRSSRVDRSLVERLFRSLDRADETHSEHANSEDGTDDSLESIHGRQKQLQVILSNMVGSLIQALSNPNMKPSEKVRGDFQKVKKRRLMRNTLLEPAGSPVCGDIDSQWEPLISYLSYMKCAADKALQIVSDAVEGTDPSTVGPNGKYLNEKTLEKLKHIRDDLNDIIGSTVNEFIPDGNQFPPNEQNRSEMKRENVRDTVDAYLNRINRMKVSSETSKRRTPMRNSESNNDFNLLTEIVKCAKELTSESRGNSETQCPLLPHPKMMSEYGTKAESQESNFRSNKRDSCDTETRKLDLRFGNIFVFPILDKKLPSEAAVRTTTAPSSTSAFPTEGRKTDQTTSTTEGFTATSSDEPSAGNADDAESEEPPTPDESEGDDKRFRSKYDKE